MAQYGKNFYGSSYYGEVASYSSQYTSTEVSTDEPLKSTFNVNINSIMPHILYGPNHSDITKYAGTWTYDATYGKLTSADPSAELRFTGTFDKCSILYEQRSTGAAKINVEITSLVPGPGTDVVKTYSFSTNSATINTNARFDITGLDYTIHNVRIWIDSTNAANTFFNFKGIDARVTDFTVETRARTGTGTWTAWTKIAITDTARSGVTNGYKITGVSPNYAGKNRVQTRVWMATSDYDVSPEIEDLEMIAGDSNNRTKDGLWEAVIDMKAISTNFKKIISLDWLETVPEGTSLTIRSLSSTDKIFWSEETVPYKLGLKRIRLREGITEGWIDTPIITPDSKYANTKTLYWDTWNDQSFLPPNSAGTTVKYIFMDTARNEAGDNYVIENPMTLAEKNLDRRKLGSKDLVVRIRMHRNHTKLATPVVDWINLKSLMEYNQTKEYSNVEFSAVDNGNTGKKVILDTAPLSSYFKPPGVDTNIEVFPGDAGKLWYKLEDKTERPLDLMLYLDSEKDTPMNRTNRSSTLTNKVWAETKERVEKHYQYGGGDVQYPYPEEVEISTSFTRSLDASKKYRYHLLKGWPTSYYRVQTEDTWETIAELYETTVTKLKAVNTKPVLNADGSLAQGYRMQIPNESVNSKVSLKWKSTTSTETSISAHNALLDDGVNKGNDSVVASVIAASTKGEIDWVSGEKIYDGVINMNDIRSEYRRVHTTPDSGDSVEQTHIVITGDTFGSIAVKYGVYEEDLRFRNDARGDEEPAVGDVLTIPSKIVLPFIVPQAIVTDNPYEVEIVANSVKTKDGKQLPETRVFPVNNLPIEVTYREKEMEAQVTKGPQANGKDPLPSPRVTEIISVSYNGTIYNEFDSFTNTGDFKKNGNFIDWGLTLAGSSEPASGVKYTVRYKCEVPDTVTIRLDTDYKEEGGIDSIWRSPEVKVYEGVCYPGKDFVMELPDVSSWIGASTSGAEDIDFVVEDNDLWVKTWVTKNEKTGDAFLIGSLQDRIPSKNWFPTIKTGYYYLGKDEYYLFSEPITVEPEDRDMPIVKNVEFVPGKFDSAALVQEASENLVRNSGFETATNKSTVFKLTFKEQGAAGLGATI